MQSKYTPLTSVVDHTTRSAIMANPIVEVGNVLGSVLDGTNAIIDEAARSYGDAKHQTATSLFEYAKSTIISSRLYLEDNLVDEAILPNLTRNLLNLYVGIIITAIGLDKFVAGGRKVSEALAVVATEAWKPNMQQVDMSQVVTDYFFPNGSQRNVSEAVLREYTCASMSAERMAISQQVDSSFEKGKSLTNEKNYNAKPIALSTKEAELPCSAVIQLDLDTQTYTNTVSTGDKKALHTDGPNAEGGSSNVRDTSSTTAKSVGKLNVLVQLRPAFIPSTVMRAFVDLNFTPSSAQRWIQVQTGEIKFFQDFLLGCDLSKRYRKAMADDKTGVLKEMLTTQANSLTRHYNKLGVSAMHRAASGSANIANTILVFEKRSFDSACSASGINFNNASVRAKFFEKTYAMIVVIVDPSYGRVEMYYNGIAQGSVFTYRQLQTNAKAEVTDIASIMRTYASGMAPRI